MEHIHHQTLNRPTPSKKPALKMVQLPVFRVRRGHLEEYLLGVYRMEGFDFLIATGSVPGVTAEYRVQAALPPGPDANRRADAIRHGHRTRDVALILNVLCLDGYIPAGQYLIDTRPEMPAIQRYRALLQQTGDPLAAPCLVLKDKYRHDRLFTQQAAHLDQIIFETQKGTR